MERKQTLLGTSMDGSRVFIEQLHELFLALVRTSSDIEADMQRLALGLFQS